MKRKIEVMIKDKDGNITFYGTKMVPVENGGKIRIPMAEILKAQREGVNRGKQSIH